MGIPNPDSPAAILDAAEARFAVQGFDATTIKQIAGDADVNSALLYYYFDDKEALYGAVVSRLIQRLATEMAQSFTGVDSTPELIRNFALRQGRMLESQPRFRKILGRELIDHDARHAQAAIRHLAATTFDRLRAAISDGQRAGIFREDIDPRFAAISLVGQTGYFHFARPAVEILLAGGKSLPPGTVDAFAAHVADFTLAALAPRVAAARPNAPTKAPPRALANARAGHRPASRSTAQPPSASSKPSRRKHS